MNPELYTEEFRNFKYLKSTPEIVSRFKSTRNIRNNMHSQLKDQEVNFEWPHVVEFSEQVLDLRDEALYIVYPGNVGWSTYETASILTVNKPMILHCNPLIYEESREATLEHVSDLDDCLNGFACLIERDSIVNGAFQSDARIIRWNTLPTAPKQSIDHTAMFYDKGTAEQYCAELTKFYHNHLGAISTISSKL